MDAHGEILLYQSEDGLTKLDVHFENETVWLTLEQMAALFGRDKSTISRHIRNVFSEGELSADATVANFATVQTEGTRQVSRELTYYNLDVIISVGYRVKSRRGVQFRLWATARLKEYMRKGFALDDERLKGHGGGDYWKELLDRIRDIRSSEKVLYRQVLDLYATSMDYDPASAESVRFFQIVQNKLHYAAHGHTAAEIIYARADAEQEFMGLRSFAGEFPVKRDTEIAKNYLDADELRVLNNLVSGYFDFAEISAIEHRPMYMKDYIQQLDAILSSGGRPLLEGAGSVSHAAALEKAHSEYRKYQQKALSPVEQAYLRSLKAVEKEVKTETGKGKKKCSSRNAL